MELDPQIAELFGLIKKDSKVDVYLGDDVTMGSVAPYGVPSGLPQLDLYLGGKGGLPAGKIIEYYGFQMVGKSTAAMQAGAEWQKRGGVVIFIDTERGWLPQRARQLGMVPERVIKYEPETVEGIFSCIDDAIDKLEKVKWDKPVLIIVDSITGVPTDADVEGNMEASERPGYEAKQIKRGVRRLNALIDGYECKPTIIFITHAFEKIGVTFGKKSASGGGHGIKFFATVRVCFTAVGSLREGSKEDAKRVGQKIAIEIEKLRGASLEYPKFNVELKNEGGFDQIEGLKMAMLATSYADKPEHSKTITFYDGLQIRTTDFDEWVDQCGGYDAVYLTWRKWATEKAILSPWGGAL